MIIGLSGKARSGKDTVAQILVEEYGFTRIAFGDILKEAVYRLNPIISLTGMRLQFLVDSDGWEVAKEIPEVRRLIQVFGTEVGRELIDPQLWVELTMSGIKSGADIVVSDVRFRNEAEEVKYQGGQMWRITRAISQPIGSHKSETEMDHWNFDQYIPNNGSIEELREEIANILWKNR